MQGDMEGKVRENDHSTMYIRMEFLKQDTKVLKDTNNRYTTEC